MNDSRVVPARLLGRRAASGGKAELVLLHRLGGNTWKALGRPARALRTGAEVVIEGASGDAGTATVLERWADGTCAVELRPEDAVLAAGHTPLPPYIHQLPADPDDYQTVYAQADGSAAAPTAGLHFTKPLLESLTDRGVRLAYVTLHVGADTFRPVSEASPEKHELHGEYFQLSAETASELNTAREEGRRIVTVGTTSTRVLEQVAQSAGDHRLAHTAKSWAHIYILPGHTFRLTNAMITNFHLPRTTLLMMISAFAGRDLVRPSLRRGHCPGIPLLLLRRRHAHRVDRPHKPSGYLAPCSSCSTLGEGVRGLGFRRGSRTAIRRSLTCYLR